MVQSLLLGLVAAGTALNTLFSCGCHAFVLPLAPSPIFPASAARTTASGASKDMIRSISSSGRSTCRGHPGRGGCSSCNTNTGLSMAAGDGGLQKSAGKPKAQREAKVQYKEQVFKEEKKKRVFKKRRVEEKEQKYVPPTQYKLLLLNDESYDRLDVMDALEEIVPNVDEAKAEQLFESAQSEGKALLGLFEKENAEMYVKELTKWDPMIFADMEEDDEKKDGEA